MLKIAIEECKNEEMLYEEFFKTRDGNLFKNINKLRRLFSRSSRKDRWYLKSRVNDGKPQHHYIKAVNKRAAINRIIKEILDASC